MAITKKDDLPPQGVDAKRGSKPGLEQVGNRQPPATFGVDYSDPVVLNRLSLYASNSLDYFFVDRFGNDYGIGVYKSDFRRIVSRLSPEAFFSVQLFNNHADHYWKTRFVWSMLSIPKTGDDPRIPEINSFVDFYDDTFHINSRKFIEKFDDLNSVSVASAAPPSPPLPEDERSRNLDALIASVPKDAGYAEQVRGFAELSHDFRREIAGRLEPILNAHVQAMPHDTHEEKQTLAKWVNGQVEPFGLAVKCPKTGLPATLRGYTGAWPGVGRFGFEVYIDGKRKVSSYSDELPELQLTDATPLRGPDAPDKASETPWQDEVGPKSGRRGRHRS